MWTSLNTAAVAGLGAAAYSLASVVLCVVAVFIGLAVARRVFA